MTGLETEHFTQDMSPRAFRAQVFGVLAFDPSCLPLRHQLHVFVFMQRWQDPTLKAKVARLKCPSKPAG
eukprot:3506882-Pyramimonas_sp.AAC.1